MNFFELNGFPHGDYETFGCKAQGYQQGNAATCPKCGKFVSMLTWLPPYRVELKLVGKLFGDFAFFPGADSFLVSDRFRETYREVGLAGLVGFEPVEVTRVLSRRRTIPDAPAYFRVEPIATEAVLDLELSGCEWVEPPTCDYCRTGQLKRRKGLVLEEGSWTGEDIFHARGAPGSAIVTERFKDTCEDYGITNALFRPAESAVVDFYRFDHPTNGTAGSA